MDSYNTSSCFNASSLANLSSNIWFYTLLFSSSKVSTYALVYAISSSLAISIECNSLILALWSWISNCKVSWPFWWAFSLTGICISESDMFWLESGSRPWSLSIRVEDSWMKTWRHSWISSSSSNIYSMNESFRFSLARNKAKMKMKSCTMASQPPIEKLFSV